MLTGDRGRRSTWYPGGIPAAARLGGINAVKGVNSLGLSTTVLPAATAGSIFHMAICSG
jgi:hypothetical protein